jgi:hypothetical protein
MRPVAGFVLVALGALAVAPPVPAAEGLWPFDHLPLDRIAADTGVRPDRDWLDPLQAGAVRLSSGCSGGLVSVGGLVATNQHCVIGCLQDAGPAGHDAIAEGFTARRREDEYRCPGLSAQVLEESRDVTPEVASAGGEDDAARRGAIAAIEARACAGAGAHRCEVVALDHGNRYRLYRYRAYDDVRLVFAAEFQAAFFGGDLDNYSYPRHCLDAALLRLYRDGQPASTPQHLAWRTSPPTAGEAVYLAGHPQSTHRSLTLAELEFERDWFLPTRQLVRAELRGRLLQYAASGPAEARAATDALFDVENRFKWFQGRSRALADAQFLGERRAAEATLRARVAADARLAAATGDPWADAAAATARYARLFLRHEFLEVRAGSVSALYRDAVQLVRAAEERAKPTAERLAEYGEGHLAQLGQQLLDAHPVQPGVERIALELWLSKAQEYLGDASPEVRRLLGRETPAALATRLVAQTHLRDPAVRAALWTGGAAAIAASEDPLIRFVRDTDAQARAVRQDYEVGVGAPLAAAGARIARARLALDGDRVPPDANFTLRLSWGRIEGWDEGSGTIAPWTTFGGLQARATGAAPYRLAPRWAAARLDPSIPFDFVASLDTVNGNSGAPVVDAAGRVLGVAFDGNLPSLGGEYGYDARRSRAVVVSSVAITAALRAVYGLDALAREVETGR